VLSFPAISRRKPVTLRVGKRAVKAGVELGDIAISPATAKRYAAKPGREFSDELKILILHGVLHLLGYDHEKDHGEMDRVERRFRKRLGLA
jgi:probable rRNA maturation factor